MNINYCVYTYILNLHTSYTSYLKYKCIIISIVYSITQNTYTHVHITQICSTHDFTPIAYIYICMCVLYTKLKSKCISTRLITIVSSKNQQAIPCHVRGEGKIFKSKSMCTCVCV